MPCPRCPGQSVADVPSVSPGDDAITAPSPFADVPVGRRSEQRTSILLVPLRRPFRITLLVTILGTVADWWV
jgi:hypothetical protein